MKAFKTLLLAAAISLLGSPAFATITFDSLVSIPSTVIGEAYTEDGFTIEFFWAVDVGTGSGAQIGGHNHFTSFDSGVAEFQHFNGSSELQGIRITKTGGGLFSVTSLDFHVHGTSFIDGFSESNVLLAAGFDPTQSAVSQFTAFAAASAAGLTTLNVGGFNNVAELWVSSANSIAFDNIVLGNGVGVPDHNSTLALMSLGLAGLALVARRRGTAR
jgi:hypothetical protein